jgi:YfiH family protein
MLIEAPALSSFPRIRHAFFTREGGASAGIYASLNGGVGSKDDPAAVAENRARMAAELGVRPDGLLSLYQIHSPEVITVEAPWTAENRPKADAMASRTPGLALAVASADCGPVLFADPHAGVIGAAHAGWKGAFTGVLEATIARMEELGATRTQIVAVLGPTIGPEAYEVGPEFVARFLDQDAGHRRFFAASERPDHAFFDLPAYILARLEATGIGEAEWLGCCTYSDDARFFSYRRSVHRGQPDYGRLISAIAITH